MFHVCPKKKTNKKTTRWNSSYIQLKKIVDLRKIDITNTHIHDHSLFWLGTCKNNVRIKLVLYPKPHLLVKGVLMQMFSTCE
jgi:hypothetical protein